MESATKEAVQKAIEWMSANFIAGGGTNIVVSLNQVFSHDHLQLQLRIYEPSGVLLSKGFLVFAFPSIFLFWLLTWCLLLAYWHVTSFDAFILSVNYSILYFRQWRCYSIVRVQIPLFFLLLMGLLKVRDKYVRKWKNMYWIDKQSVLVYTHLELVIYIYIFFFSHKNMIGWKQMIYSHDFLK